MTSEETPAPIRPNDQAPEPADSKAPEPTPKKGWREALKKALPGKKKDKPSPNIYPLF
jgi:hypothetical protein